MKAGEVYIVGGFSGAGKGSILKEILRRHPELEPIRSCTTREKRGEDDSYIFLSEKQFADLEAQKKFLETNFYGGYRYGTPVNPVARTLADGRSPLLEIDANGLIKLKKSELLAERKIRSVFIAVTNPAVLYKRLIARESESFSSIQKRMEEVKGQCDYLEYYDCIILNDDHLEKAIGKFEAFLQGEECGSAFDKMQFRENLGRLQEEIKSRGIDTLEELEKLAAYFADKDTPSNSEI